MKTVISTPSGREISFAEDEEVRHLCDENGEHWLMLCKDDGAWLYREKHELFYGMVLQAKPAKDWTLEFSET
jgi:hypothetical protein